GANRVGQAALAPGLDVGQLATALGDEALHAAGSGFGQVVVNIGTDDKRQLIIAHTVLRSPWDCAMSPVRGGAPADSTPHRARSRRSIAARAYWKTTCPAPPLLRVMVPMRKSKLPSEAL